MFVYTKAAPSSYDSSAFDRENPQVYRWAQKLVQWGPASGNKEAEMMLDNLGLSARLLILWKGGE